MKNTLREAQLQTLRKRLRGHHLEAMMILALVTGIRRDELRGLTWSDFNLETGTIRVEAFSMYHLVSRHCSYAQKAPSAPGGTEQGCRYREAELDLVFPDHTGAKRSSQHFLQEWYAVCEHVGFPHLRFHHVRVFLWRQLIEQDGDTRGGHERSLDCDENADEQ